MHNGPRSPACSDWPPWCVIVARSFTDPEPGLANYVWFFNTKVNLTVLARTFVISFWVTLSCVLADIQSGRFVKNFVLDNRAGQPELKAARKAAEAHPIEKTGAQLRAMMPWIGANKLVDQEKN